MTDKPRVVFLGTPDFAVPILETLHGVAHVALVVSQPDRPAGRGRKTLPPPVKMTALRLGLEVVQPAIAKGRRFAARIAAYEPDFLVTAAFGRVLGPCLLEVPRIDSLNVHASVLPRHRGAAPINWAILSGDTETGVSVMRMVRGLDEGPVFHVEKTPIGPEETAGELSERLSRLGARALAFALANFESLVPVPQENAQATWATIPQEDRWSD